MSEFDSTAFLAQAPELPGVYRMYAADDELLYVGKAKSLKKRLASYFRSTVTHRKTLSLVSQIARIETIITNSETEALILENNLIKQHLPRYNVLLRDDKSYPYILLSEHRHPRLAFHRGARRQKGRYFGPFPSGGAVRASLKLMQKVFAVRQCDDSYYRNRSRPCLQYQLKRCTAPCVTGLVSDGDYNQQVEHTRLFLEGKHNVLIDRLVAQMESASQSLNFETAAQYRDQILALRQIQEAQGVSGDRQQLDVITLKRSHGISCVQVLSVRGGKLLGSRSYYPKVGMDQSDDEVLESFIMQFYLADVSGRIVPMEVIVPTSKVVQANLQQALSHVAERQIHVITNPRGEGRTYLELAQTNATNALATQLADRVTMEQRFLALQNLLEMEQSIGRMECFDISHTMGEQTVASCVVFNSQGPSKADYRRYNISGITGGDDYAAMKQALQRRYRKIDGEKVPDILFIDGGKGQLRQAVEVMDEITWPQGVTAPLLIGVAKGEGRKPGLETLILSEGWEIIPTTADSPALHLVQHIRDEAHRFAITGHRKQRAKAKRTSTLESIPGVGEKRRQQLLKYLGGLQGVKKASVDELCRVPTISRNLAEDIYSYLNE